MRKFVFVLIMLIFCSPVWAEPIASFQGHFNPANSTVSGILDLGEYRKFNIDAGKLSAGVYQFTIGMSHLFLLGRDVTSVVKGTVERVVDAYQEIVYLGRLGSNYSLINYQPIRELECSFQIRKNVLYIQSLIIGSLSISGTVGILSPFSLDLEVKLKDVELNDFIDFWMQPERSDASGKVNGIIKVSGGLDNVYLKGDLTASTGHVGRMDFGDMQISAMGYYPVVQLTKTQLSTTDGLVYSISGALDFSKKGTIAKQVKSLTIAPVIFNSESGSEWTIKKSSSDEGINAWKSIIKTDGSKRNLDEHDSGVLGVERRLEF
ncbi:MAG: hypothetical protein HQL25_07185 [Candidatus Omnitrophica bacterium]|nr:hypothetical protein [Candidatus Omnitrophota bacterium]